MTPQPAEDADDGLGVANFARIDCCQGVRHGRRDNFDVLVFVAGKARMLEMRTGEEVDVLGRIAGRDVETTERLDRPRETPYLFL